MQLARAYLSQNLLVSVFGFFFQIWYTLPKVRRKTSQTTQPRSAELIELRLFVRLPRAGGTKLEKLTLGCKNGFFLGTTSSSLLTELKS